MERNSFTCSKCSKQIKFQHKLIKHEEKCNVKRSCLRCPDCNVVFARMDNFRIHAERAHNITPTVKRFNFKNDNEFEEWKSQMEKEHLSFYFKQRSCKDRLGQTKSYYYCHRSGFFTSESKGIRRIKSQGSNKINATCTSSMVVTKNESGVDVIFHETHFGHGSNLGRCRLNKEERMMIEGILFHSDSDNTNFLH